ncbi:hypothetical protein PENTCL1PPCAC_2450 [Pristionchus entomophagus]|uniref:Uncharacterized protein n=1 Tax=Pristionchus entomophagus TaxID=358040 RepID=A0AAV5SCW7_9BILA|nr:hypothetical protein PENTCL1PPCAC_2450 [Pristionchus entomophagus]
MLSFLFLLPSILILVHLIPLCYWKKKQVKVTKQLKVAKKPKKRDDFLTRLQNQVTNDHDDNSISKTAEGDESKKKTKKNKDLMRPSREQIDNRREELMPSDSYEKVGPSQEKPQPESSGGGGSKETIPPGSLEKEKGGSASVEKLSNEKASGSKEKSKEKEQERAPETELRPLQSTQSTTKKTEYTPSSCSNTQHNSNSHNTKSHHAAHHFKEIPKPDKRVTSMNMKFGSGETIGSAEILKNVKMGEEEATQSTQKSSSETLKSQMTQIRSVAQAPTEMMTEVRSVMITTLGKEW